MLRSLRITALAAALSVPAAFAGESASVQPAVYHPSTDGAHAKTVAYAHRRHRRHGVRKTVKRVGIGAAGGAAIGAIAGGGPGAAIGAVAGGGAGAIYDHHEKKKGN